MWTYDQSSGELRKDGALFSLGYSGKGRGKNNPALQGMQGLGPIPRGDWHMVRVYNSANVGPYAIELHAIDAKPDDDTHQPTGRGAFRVHGDSIKNPGSASNGCIILPRNVRERMWKSNDHLLRVIE